MIHRIIFGERDKQKGNQGCVYLKIWNRRMYFTICKIPHGSGNTGQISDYLKAFADEHGLYCRQDELNNIIMIKESELQRTYKSLINSYTKSVKEGHAYPTFNTYFFVSVDN